METHIGVLGPHTITEEQHKLGREVGRIAAEKGAETGKGKISGSPKAYGMYLEGCRPRRPRSQAGTRPTESGEAAVALWFVQAYFIARTVDDSLPKTHTWSSSSEKQNPQPKE